MGSRRRSMTWTPLTVANKTICDPRGLDRATANNMHIHCHLSKTCHLSRRPSSPDTLSSLTSGTTSPATACYLAPSSSLLISSINSSADRWQSATFRLLTDSLRGPNEQEPTCVCVCVFLFVNFFCLFACVRAPSEVFNYSEIATTLDVNYYFVLHVTRVKYWLHTL